MSKKTADKLPEPKLTKPFKSTDDDKEQPTGQPADLTQPEQPQPDPENLPQTFDENPQTTDDSHVLTDANIPDSGSITPEGIAAPPPPVKP